MQLVFAMTLLTFVLISLVFGAIFKGHNFKQFEQSVKKKLLSLFTQPEYEQVENYGKAHCIVMDLAEAISEEDQILQYEQTQVVFQRAETYSHQVKTNRIDLPVASHQQTLLKVVK